jgi:hypothetical protein
MKESNLNARKTSVRAELVEVPAGYALDEAWPDQPFDRHRANGNELARNFSDVDQALARIYSHFWPASLASIGVCL